MGSVCDEHQRGTEVMATTERQPSSHVTTDTSSFLHKHKKQIAGNDDDYNYIGDRSQAIYEELCDIQMSAAKTAEASQPPPLPDVVLESSYYDGTNDHHYTTIEGGEQNIYDDVITAAVATRESRKRPAADEDDSYETVQAPLPPPLPQAVPVSVGMSSLSTSTPILLPVDGVRGNSNLVKKELSDSSMEIDNSIYGLNPPSESTSSGKFTHFSLIFRKISKITLKYY